MSLSTTEILKAFVKLGEFIIDDPAELDDKIRTANVHNAWFTKDNIIQSLHAISSNYLDEDLLKSWLGEYIDVSSFPESNSAKSIGVIAAGNIPLVGFHDILSVLITGNNLLVKISAKDSILLPYLLEKLTDFEPLIKDRISLCERLKNYDAVIATGNNNSARYFEYYFGNVPNIIRKNRNSVAVLNGKETPAELKNLGHDVFDYFGLGCRNISKLYVPDDYDLNDLREPFESFRWMHDHNQYRNNLDYNRTLLMMNNIPFEDLDFVNVTHNPSIASAISNLHYQYYKSENELSELLLFNRNQIQCIAGNNEKICTVRFGETQSPGLADYADDLDTIRFLRNLN